MLFDIQESNGITELFVKFHTRGSVCFRHGRHNFHGVEGVRETLNGKDLSKDSRRYGNTCLCTAAVGLHGPSRVSVIDGALEISQQICALISGTFSR